MADNDLSPEEQRRLHIQLRANRDHALNGWLGRSDGGRWDGDDGRPLRLAEFQFWPAAIRAAEEAEFARLDAAYETAKAAAGLPAGKPASGRLVDELTAVRDAILESGEATLAAAVEAKRS